MPENVLMLTLQTFSTTGGIQKMTRTLGYSISQLAKAHGFKFRAWSLYDSPQSLMARYIPQHEFKGFSNSRIKFVLNSITIAMQTDYVILTHINLALVGILIKILNPDCKVYLVAHGIEVWRPLSLCQKLLLKYCHQILCVSAYTQQQITKHNRVDAGKAIVLNNALDPFMQLPANLCKPDYLIQRYQIKPGEQVVLTLTRLASTEQYKGYEKVIEAIERLKCTHPALKYILAGQHDAVELHRIETLIARHKVKDQVLVTGFIPDEELTDHFLLADLFVLPSKKEGFGLVFIEALACGLPVICGNADGSIDAIKQGELGHSLNADDVDALQNHIAACLNHPLTLENRKLLQFKCTNYFNEAAYRNQLWNIFNNEPVTA